jgi:hypothetical protein
VTKDASQSKGMTSESCIGRDKSENYLFKNANHNQSLEFTLQDILKAQEYIKSHYNFDMVAVEQELLANTVSVMNVARNNEECHIGNS